MTKFYNTLTKQWTRKKGSNFMDYLRQKKQKQPFIDFDQPEQFYNKITKQWIKKQGDNYTDYKNKLFLKEMQTKLDRGSVLRTKQHLTKKEQQEMRSIQDFIMTNKQLVFSMEPRPTWDIHKIKTYLRDFTPPEKFPNNYYQFLTKKMMNPNIKSARDIIDRFHTEREQGLAFEAIWTILISMGFCQKFNRQQYDFYDATLKEDTPSKTTGYFKLRKVSNAEYIQFLRHNQIKGTNGKSDITLRRKSDGQWIFISCKYYKGEHGNYDVPVIYESILKTNEKYPELIGDNYEIYIFSKNKEKTLKECDKNIKQKIKSKSNRVYNIMGLDDLEVCFHKFQQTFHNRMVYFQMMNDDLQRDKLRDRIWQDFQRSHLKRYYQLPLFQLKIKQVPIFNKTYNIILNNREACGPPETLKIFWKTIPQFGKSYCVAMLFLEYSKLQRSISMDGFFNAVIVVNNIDVLKQYSRNIFGGYKDFVDYFNIIEVANETTQQKIVRKTMKPLNKNKHNILIVLKDKLKHVYGLENLRFIVFDETDDASRTEFNKFSASPSRIGLFLTSSIDKKLLPTQQEQQKQKTVCEYLLEWTWEDDKIFENIIRNIKNIKTQKHPYSQYIKTELAITPEHRLEKCLKDKLDLYIVSHFIQENNNIYSRIFKDRMKVQRLLAVLKRTLQQLPLIQGKSQLWFLPHINNLFIGETLRSFMKEDDYFSRFDIVLEKEKHPPFKDTIQMISHYQTMSSSNKRDGTIFLLDPKTDIKGIPFPNVETVVSLNNDKPETELAYLMMSKCATTNDGKKSAYFIDLNSNRTFDMIDKEFGSMENIMNRKLVKLIDISEPQLRTSQVIQNMMKKKQDINRYITENKDIYSAVRSAQTQQYSNSSSSPTDWRSKPPSTLDKNQLRQMARYHNVAEQHYINLNRSNLYNLLRQKKIIQPRTYSRSSST